MKFEFKISKWANFYYFLHNFAECEWPWPYRPKGPITVWKKKFGDFSIEEKSAIDLFKEIYNKHFLKIYIGKLFFESDNPWTELEKQLPNNDTNALKKAFSVFEEKFDKIFEDNYGFLENWKKELSLKFKNKSLVKEIGGILSNFFGVDLSRKEFNIFLLLGSDLDISLDKYISGAGGERGRGLDEGNILLEFNINCPVEKIDYIQGVIWHEVAHYCIDKSSYNKLASRIIKPKKAVNYVSELIIRSLLPVGIIGMEFFNAPEPLSLTFKQESLPFIETKETEKIIKLIDSSIKDRKKIDGIYIEDLIKILSGIEKWATLLRE
ncbi:MAG: hypothetical protein NUV87_01300 [Candidatus Roizmanbacteria bacterium]|nr:hypothetical protein [Candidatus Roizmanbacteria bacterium]